MSSQAITHYPVHTSPCSRVQLGAMKREYLERLVPWANDLEATGGLRLNPPVMYEHEVEWFDSLPKARNQEVFAILVKDDSAEGEYQYVGHTGLHNIHFPSAHATSGTFIGDPKARGRGIGKIAKLLLLHHAFHHAGLRKVVSDVKSFNLASIGHLIACGYKVVGVQRDHYFHEGDFVDRVILEIHRADFEPIWGKYQRTERAPSLSVKQKKRIAKLNRT